jgi:glutamate racemase
VKLLVVACNSASAAAFPALQARMMETTLGVDVIGVVSPAAVQAVAATRNGRVGLLATDVTVRSGAYDEAVVETVRGYCRPLREAGVDTVILGSTHYPLVRPMIQRMLGREVDLITSGGPLSRQVDHVLGSRGLGNPHEGEGDYRFLCTGDVPAFKELGTRFLQMPLGEVEHVELPAAVHG